VPGEFWIRRDHQNSRTLKISNSITWTYES
jgi:hypothetical protein